MNLDSLRKNDGLREAWLFGLGVPSAAAVIRYFQEFAERAAIKVDLDCTMVHIGRLLR